MRKLLQNVGEYFLGTQSHDFYKHHREFIIEHEQNAEDITALLEEINSHERSFLLRRKILPTLITGASIVAAFLTRNNAYLLFVPMSEGTRFCDMGNKDESYMHECLELQEAYSEELRLDKSQLPDILK